MSDLPSGTVTFLFTDIEGSTRLLRELGAQAYDEALAEHRRALREAFARRGGVEVDTQGDAFFYAFQSASDALEAARAGQEALSSGPVRVRMGLHTGRPHLGREGYVGEDVHLAARIAASAHGRQVVCSKATRALVGGELADLGEHRLKDMPEPVWIYQLGPERFPPLKTISNTNLPRPASSFVGREHEVSDVVSLLQDGARLVTLSGPGGSGKTRLAIEAAAELVPEFKNGVFWVGMAPLRDAALVTETVAQTLGAQDGLAEHVGERELLLLLDNFEQVVQAAPGLVSLLEACPNLRLLVTSRELLRIRGEVDYPVPPLADPEAAELFCTRSRVEADEAIGELCRRLDNLPLAVELAAARTSVLTPAQILERLSQRLDVLKGGRDAEARQQTLRATIEWSYDLLSEEEKVLFARLSAFAGGCTLEAAEQVAEADLDTLQALVDKSLLRFTEGRFWMLETIREFAAERLEESGEADDLRARHADHFLGLVPPSDVGIHVAEPHTKESLDRLEEDYDNVRAAFEWLVDAGDAARAIVTANSLFWTFLNVRGRTAEGQAMLNSALSMTGESDPGRRSDALVTLGIICGDMGDLEPARAFAGEALELARTLDDSPREQRALRTLARYQADLADKRRMLLECDALARSMGDDTSLSWVQMLLGYGAIEAGDYEEARLRFEQWLALAVRGGRRTVILHVFGELGCLAALDRRFDDARELLTRSLHAAVELGAMGYASASFEGLAAVALATGEPERATRLLGVAARLREEGGDFLQRHQRPLVERTEAGAREQLGDRFTEIWAAGQALSFDEAAELALCQA